MPRSRRPAGRALAAFVALAAFAILFAALVALATTGGAMAAGDALSPAWSPDERERILALGPWPPPPALDERNPVSGQPAAIAFGEALFHSTRLSRVPGLRCASCHEPWRGFTDGRRTALGAEAGELNTPTLLNIAQQHRFGWTGAHDQLWAQSLRPMLDAREMRADAGFLAAQLRADAPLSALYAGSFGRAPPADDQALMLDLARALAAYQETLVSPRTPFDRFRDALALGEERSAGYPAAAQRGLRLFIGQAQCVACHAGPAFSDGALHGRFRTPPLRELAATAPYLHDGRLANLCDTLAPHAPLPTASAAAPALSLDQRRDLVAFLLSLGAQGIPAHAERSSFDCR